MKTVTIEIDGRTDEVVAGGYAYKHPHLDKDTGRIEVRIGCVEVSVRFLTPGVADAIARAFATAADMLRDDVKAHVDSGSALPTK